MSKKFLPFDSELTHRTKRVIAQGALTNSKRPECFVKGAYPTHLKRGSGCFVWDSKGNRYIDFICGLGSNLLGYATPEINEELIRRLDNGITLSLGTELELEAAEKVKELFPFVEKLKFLKTGSEACSAAIRIARAKTGKSNVASIGYHGWHDEFTSLSAPAHGVPKQHTFSFDHIDQLRADSLLAAVIVEPVMTDMTDSRRNWLSELRTRCNQLGAMLIFDEVITGFRTPKFSISNHWGIEPDLICLGKAIANGMPLAVVGGRESIMECEEYFISSTFAGETLSLASALKTMQLLQTPKFNIDYLWEKGAEFLFKFNSIWPEGVKIAGYPTRGVFEGHIMHKALFWQESVKAGILFGPSFFFNFHHIGLMDPILSTCKDILLRVKCGAVKLEGDLPVAPFAQKVRQR